MDFVLMKNLYEIETSIMEPEETKKLLESLKDPQKANLDDEYLDTEDSKTSEDYRHENELLKKYLEEENEDFKDIDDDDDEGMDKLLASTGMKKDEAFEKFVKLCSPYPKQILRYCRHPQSEPLWITDAQIPDIKAIPKCELCGSKRIFEFQLNSQILNYAADLVMLDWGVLAFYT